MSREHDLDFRYLRALLEINKGVAHQLRGPLGALGLQVELIQGNLKRGPDDLEAWQKIEKASQVAHKNFWELNDWINLVLWATRPAKDDLESQDLRKILRNVCRLLAAHLKEHHIELELHLPPAVVGLDGDRDAVQRTLLVVFFEASHTMTPGQTFEVDLDGDGVLQVNGAPAHQWLPKVAGNVEEIGGALDAGPQDSIVVIRLPIQMRI